MTHLIEILRQTIKPASVDKYNQSLDRIRNELNNAKMQLFLHLGIVIHQ